MGLDNGIIVRGKTQKGRDFIDEYYGETEKELVYWRKNWNMRGRMFEIFAGNKSDEDKYHTELSLFDLVTVVEKVLKYFLIEENWDNEEYGRSIWEWDEAIRSIADQIHGIRDFLYDVKIEKIHNSDLEIYFYDSY